MPLEVGLSPGNLALDGDPAPRLFSAMFIVATVAHLSYC